MKKAIAPIAAVVMAFGLGACTSDTTNPIPTPTISVPALPTVPTVPTVDPGATPTRTRPPAPTTAPTTKPTPRPTQSTTQPSVEPPAVQFLKVWGTRYPRVQERQIADAAESTCARINAAMQDGTPWTGNDDVTSDVVAYMEQVGMGTISSSTANSFAADAYVRYCPIA